MSGWRRVGALEAGPRRMSAETDEGWRQFDALVGAQRLSSPWGAGAGGELVFSPQFELLEKLLAVPIRLGLSTQSGMPAKAVDVWVAHELRRAGFLADEVWPRAAEPRVLPREVALLRRFPGMLKLSDQDPSSGAALAEDLDDGKAIDIAITIRHDLIPEGLLPDRFLAAMVSAVLERTPVDLHEGARRRRGQEVPDD